jgi:hypothetical protein
MMVIQKKDVPVRAILERITSNYTSQVAQCSKAMKGGAEVGEICNDLASDEDGPGNDSGVGMDQQVEMAQQEFENT